MRKKKNPFYSLTTWRTARMQEKKKETKEGKDELTGKGKIAEVKPLKEVAGVKLLWNGKIPSKKEEIEQEKSDFLKEKGKQWNKWAFLVFKGQLSLGTCVQPKADTCLGNWKPSHPLMAITLNAKGERNYLLDPDFLYSEGRLHRQPRNRGAIEGNVYQLFPKSEMMTF